MSTLSEADRWNQRYGGRSASFGEGPSPFLAECLEGIARDTAKRGGDSTTTTPAHAGAPLIPPRGQRRGRALDIAMGEGRHALQLAAKGFWVVGVDVSLVAAARAARSASRRGLSLSVVANDLERWCFEVGSGSGSSSGSGFDLITQFCFLDRALFPVLIESLRPGGYLVLETFSSRHPEVSSFGPHNPEFLLDPGEAKTLLGDLELIVFEDRVVELDEGKHQGPAGLIRVLAHKPS